MPGKKEKTAKQRWAYIIIAMAVLIIAYFIPTPEGLETAGKMGIALLISGVILWVTEALPLGISTFAIMALMYICNVATPTEIWTNWASTSIFFVLAAFGISTAMLKTSIPTRIVFRLLHIAKGKTKRCVFAFMVATWFISMFISDFPATALMSGIAVGSILELEKAVPGKSKLGKCLLIGIPLSSVVGGAAIPTGSAMNIMAMGMLTATTGITISFLDWMIVCLPISIVLLLTVFFSLTLVFKPEPISDSTIQQIEEKSKSEGALDPKDKKFLVFIVTMFILWISSNWTGWDATVIALCGLVVLFLPGVDLLTWKEYREGVSWDIIILVGGVSSLAHSLQKNGAGSWLYSVTVGKFAVGAVAVIASVAIFLPLVKLLIPVGPALIAVFMPPLTAAAESIGISPAVFAIMLGVNASNTFLLGLDSNHMLTYKYRYWTFGDFFKSGLPPTIMMMILHATVVAPVMALLGY